MDDGNIELKYNRLLGCIYTALSKNYNQKVLEDEVSSLLLKPFMQDLALNELSAGYKVEQANYEYSVRMYENCDAFLQEAKLIMCGSDASKWKELPELPVPQNGFPIPVEAFDRIQEVCESLKKKLRVDM